MSTNHGRNTYRILSREVWDEIRRQYIDGCGPAEVCRRFGVARSTLTTRRAIEGWDELRAEVTRIRRDGGSSSSCTQYGQDEAPLLDEASGSNSRIAVENPVTARGDGRRRETVRNAPATDPACMVETVNDAYLALAGALRKRVDAVVAEQRVTSSSTQRPHRDVLDAASALEKLQRVERSALGLNDRDNVPRGNVVILVPSKLDDDEWQAAVERSVSQDHGDTCSFPRSSTTWDGGRIDEDVDG